MVSVALCGTHQMTFNISFFKPNHA